MKNTLKTSLFLLLLAACKPEVCISTEDRINIGHAVAEEDLAKLMSLANQDRPYAIEALAQLKGKLLQQHNFDSKRIPENELSQIYKRADELKILLPSFTPQCKESELARLKFSLPSDEEIHRYKLTHDNEYSQQFAKKEEEEKQYAKAARKQKLAEEEKSKQLERRKLQNDTIILLTQIDEAITQNRCKEAEDNLQEAISTNTRNYNDKQEIIADTRGRFFEYEWQRPTSEIEERIADQLGRKYIEMLSGPMTTPEEMQKANCVNTLKAAIILKENSPDRNSRSTTKLFRGMHLSRETHFNLTHKVESYLRNSLEFLTYKSLWSMRDTFQAYRELNTFLRLVKAPDNPSLYLSKYVERPQHSLIPEKLFYQFELLQNASGLSRANGDHDRYLIDRLLAVREIAVKFWQVSNISQLDMNIREQHSLADFNYKNNLFYPVGGGENDTREFNAAIEAINKGENRKAIKILMSNINIRTPAGTLAKLHNAGYLSLTESHPPAEDTSSGYGYSSKALLFSERLRGATFLALAASGCIHASKQVFYKFKDNVFDVDIKFPYDDDFTSGSIDSLLERYIDVIASNYALFMTLESRRIVGLDWPFSGHKIISELNSSDFWACANDSVTNKLKETFIAQISRDDTNRTNTNYISLQQWPNFHEADELKTDSPDDLSSNYEPEKYRRELSYYYYKSKLLSDVDKAFPDYKSLSREDFEFIIRKLTKDYLAYIEPPANHKKYVSVN